MKVAQFSRVPFPSSPNPLSVHRPLTDPPVYSSLFEVGLLHPNKRYSYSFVTPLFSPFSPPPFSVSFCGSLSLFILPVWGGFGGFFFVVVESSNSVTCDPSFVLLPERVHCPLRFFSLRRFVFFGSFPGDADHRSFHPLRAQFFGVFCAALFFGPIGAGVMVPFPCTRRPL